MPEGHTVTQRTLTSWRNVLSATSRSSARTSAKSCIWGGTTPGTNTCWGYPAVKQLIRKGAGGGTKLNTSQHCAPVTKEVDSALRYIRKSAGSMLKSGILPLYSAPVRSHLECCVLFWWLSVWSISSVRTFLNAACISYFATYSISVFLAKNMSVGKSSKEYLLFVDLCFFFWCFSVKNWMLVEKDFVQLKRIALEKNEYTNFKCNPFPVFKEFLLNFFSVEIQRITK